MNRIIIPSLVLLLMQAHAYAQDNVKPSFGGNLELQAASGNTTARQASVQLDIKSAKLTVSPYLGVTTDNHYCTSRTEESRLTYSASGDQYTGFSQFSSFGQNYRYGLKGNYKMLPTLTIDFAATGQYRNLVTEGNRTEMLSMAKLTRSQWDHTSVENQPRNKTHLLDLNLGLTKLFPAHGSRMTLRGAYVRNSKDLERDYESLSGRQGAYPMEWYQYLSHTVTSLKNLTADYHHPLAPGQTLGFGARYEGRDIEAVDQQRIDQDQNVKEGFNHEYQTYGVFADYALTSQLFDLRARLAYDHTRMFGRDLNDVIPQLSAVWKINSSQNLELRYGMRVVRPEAELLNPMVIRGAYTIDYGNVKLTGIHLNNAALVHTYKAPQLKLTTTLSHIFVDDGFNAIWMIKDGLRLTTWGNEGIRRAWSVNPALEWQNPQSKTTLNASVNVLWDKRIAEAINMTKEHWGITTQLRVRQALPLGIMLNLHGEYSEGNTIDLYSHASRSMSYGASLQRTFYHALEASLSYSNTEYARTIITQGAYTGVISNHPDHRHILNIALRYRF